MNNLSQPMRTFDEVFSEHTVTTRERTALVWHLAEYRARKTVEALLQPNPYKLGLRTPPSETLNIEATDD